MNGSTKGWPRGCVVRDCGSNLVLGKCAIVSYDFLALKLREIVIHPWGEVEGKTSVLSTFSILNRSTSLGVGMGVTCLRQGLSMYVALASRIHL